MVTVVKPAIAGRYLAHNHLNLVERAFLALDIATGAKPVTKLTLTQAAHLARVSISSARMAKRRQTERAAILAGYVPLNPPPSSTPKTNGRTTLPVLNGKIDDSAVVAFVRHIGVERVLEAAVAVEAAQ
jgi:hypothetical protein